mgnify:CR=1 FL=1
MYKVTYEVVTRNGKHVKTRYFSNTTKKMSSRILPSLLRFFFATHPHESLVYAKLYQFVEE